MVRLAVVQPHSYRGSEEPKNVSRSLEYISTAAENEADIVVMPEGYPGPADPEKGYDSFDSLSEAANEHEIYLVESHIEPTPDGKNHYMCLQLIGPDGSSQGIYHRTTPEGPYLYPNIDDWGFDYVAGDELPVFETEWGTLGMLVCSEVYAPELSRILAMKGAEICVFPAGALINELMPTWQAMIRARAIENLMYTASCQNVYGVEEGVAMIAGPEEVLGKKPDEGVLVRELDLERLRWLRDQKEETIEVPKPYKVLPGTLNWHRSELYEKNYEDW